MKYKITGPETYEREIAGIKFDKGVAITDDKWLAEWFSGRDGFTVTTEKTASKPARSRSAE